jgi:hypothetical protein
MDLLGVKTLPLSGRFPDSGRGNPFADLVFDLPGSFALLYSLQRRGTLLA